MGVNDTNKIFLNIERRNHFERKYIFFPKFVGLYIHKNANMPFNQLTNIINTFFL